ncbi:ExeA family protein [Chitinimonas lacunae]|uniref:ExeA family protein n=1 Tax=Chitinimonas lacunae TaxID=1963018 RepID=A0ABV8MWM5_9NEIS
MYLDYLGLHAPPFALLPDTAFFYAGWQHQAALNTLLLASSAGEGFIKITGEVGTGKTLLCRTFLAALEADCLSAFLPNPCLTPPAILSAIASELGLADFRAEEPLQALHGALIEQAARGRRVVLCLDEAQAMSDEGLETLRLLGNLETEKQKLLQVVLFGQPELDQRLARRELRQFAQRIAFSHRLGVLAREELDAYLGHRLGTAGYRGAPLFSQAAAAALYRYSGGVPRLINILAHKTLLLLYGRGQRRVRAADVAQAALDTPAAPRRWLAHAEARLPAWLGT